MSFFNIVPTARRVFDGPGGRTWEAEISLHSGTDRQAPELLVIFRDPVRVQPDRYTLLPPGAPKRPREAAKQLSDDELRALIQRSVPLSRR